MSLTGLAGHHQGLNTASVLIQRLRNPYVDENGNRLNTASVLIQLLV